MASEKQHEAAPDSASLDKSCSYSLTTGTSQVSSEKTATVRRALRCTDCGKKFDDWRLLQRHKRKTCAKSSLRFSCRECKAYFLAKVELDSHISAAHVKTEHKSKGTCSRNSSQKNINTSSLSRSDKRTIEQNSKWNDVRKCHKKSQKLKIRRSALACKMAKQVGKFKTRMKDGKKCKVHDKTVVETCIVGSNPFLFTTSYAPDAQSFQFLCQSCLTCRFATYVELRQHEDWCARVPASHGYVCLPCGRHYRNQGTLHRHADEHHYAPFSSEVKKTLVNPYLFSTTIAQDAASHPHVCSSCLIVCFTSPALLRRHEDWCGQCTSPKDGFKCDKCGRYFRTAELQSRHADAADCGKTDSTGAAGDCIVINDDAEVTSLESDAVQKTTATTHGICPLCDMPYATQYEQQFHFLNVHNLSSSDLKIKQAFDRHSKRALAGTQVTCLDCDKKVSSRLELVQHKRVCTKEKEAKPVILPVTVPVSTSVKGKSASKGFALKNRKPHKNKRSAATAVSSSTSGKITASSKNQNENGIRKLSSSRAVNTACTQSTASRSLLLDSTKVRKLISSAGAKQLVLKRDGELIVLGNGGEKSSATTTSDKTSRVCKGTETRPILVINATKQEKADSSLEEPRAISYVTVDSDLLIESPPSLQSRDKTKSCCSVLRMDKNIRSEDPKPTTEGRELVSCEENHGDTEKHINTKTHEINDNIDTVSHPVTVADFKSTEDKNTPQVAVKECSVAVTPLKLSRKRSWKDKVTDAVDTDAETHSNLAHEVNSGKKSSAVEKGLGVRNTRSKTSLDEACNSVVQAVNVSASPSAAKVPHVESASEVTSRVKQAMLPQSQQHNSLQDTAARYPTRSVAHARATGRPAAKKGRFIHSGKELSTAKGSGEKEHQLLADGNMQETVEVNKQERRHVSTMSVPQTTHANTSKQQKCGSLEEPASLPQTTWTVEPAGDGLVRCAVCKSAFQTVRQISDHKCAGH